VTTIEVTHSEHFPQGVFEFQHATGDTIEDSIRCGVEQWAKTDLVALLDALRPKAETCMTMEISFPEAEGKPARFRRAVLSPVTHLQLKPPAQQAGADDEHPFCPCCLLTRSFEAFKGLFENDGFFGIRLFAARDQDGSPQADCRVNGMDWEAGAVALRQYVETWPGEGYEFRKQYVVLHNISNHSATRD
jgi:hypothetical protein